MHEVGRRAAILEMESQTRQQKMKALLGGQSYDSEPNPFLMPMDVKSKSILLQDNKINAIVPYTQKGLPKQFARNNLLIHF